MAVILFLNMQGIAGAYEIVNFGSSSAEVTAKLAGPEDTFGVDIWIPAECHILGARMNLSALGPEPGHPAYPEAAGVFLNDTLLWEFNGTGCGALGMQDGFVDGSTWWSSRFGGGGGANGTSIRIPKKASVLNAVMEANCSGSEGFFRILNLTGAAPYDFLGYSVSDAGDVNADGYDDLVVGAYGNDTGGPSAGIACIFLGGAAMDAIPDVVMKGAAGDMFGSSVAAAGDVNNDGCDDVAVGAPHWGGDVGRAYIFLGGSVMNGTPNITLTGDDTSNFFGTSVAGVRDVNGDGYDDVVVGDRGNSVFGISTGRAFVYLGGAAMDGSADLNMTGAAAYDQLGHSVSGAGDVNGDGYFDIVVGAPGNDEGDDMSGRAYVLYGGASMDGYADMVFSGEASGDTFGYSVSGAGDVNADGFDDVMVGAPWNDAAGSFAGRAYIYLGGAIKDTVADVFLTGETGNDFLGNSVSNAGDVNGDGYDDVLAGAYGNDAGGDSAGRAYLFFGGPTMDGNADVNLTGAYAGDMYGFSVSGAGDTNKDGCDDVVVGAHHNCTGGINAGRAYLRTGAAGVLGPSVAVGKHAVMDIIGYINGTSTVSDFSNVLNEYLQAAIKVVMDGYGNAYVDVPVVASAMGGGAIRLGLLNITYNYTATLPDFSDELNSYLSAHRSEKDAAGKLPVPLKVRSLTPSRIRLQDLKIVADMAPEQTGPIPDLEMDEDTSSPQIVDLHRYFKDDTVDVRDLSFELASATNSSVIAASVTDNRYISLDAAGGTLNDNWTGTVEIAVNVYDMWGSKTLSNLFRVRVMDVLDSPVITSVPPVNATAGAEYRYRVRADDGDGDALTYSLAKGPGGMFMDDATGDLSWMPAVGGLYGISIAVGDGTFTAYQNFTIHVANRPPRTVSSTVPAAYVDVPFIFDVLAADDDNDTLGFALMKGVPGMTIEAATGRMHWTPAQVGTFPVSVGISDGNETVVFDFDITVVRLNRAPTFLTAPVTGGTVGLPYSCNSSARDTDGDPLTYSLIEMPPGMSVEASSGRLNWTPASAGNFTVRLKVSDGMGGEAFQEFTVNVSQRAAPKLVFLTPLANKKVKGTVTVSGRAFSGTLEIVDVQVRVDGGSWSDANGTSIWLFQLECSGLKNGEHRLQARAFDGIDYSEPVNRTILVDNMKPAGGKGMVAGFEGIGLVAGVLIMLIWNRPSLNGHRH